MSVVTGATLLAARYGGSSSVFVWGESEMIWTQGFVELFRWRRQRRLLAAQAATLVVETERWLAAGPHVAPPLPPTRATPPPRPSEPPRSL